MPTLQETMIAVVLSGIKTVVEFLAHHPEADLARCERLVQDFQRRTASALLTAVVEAAPKREPGRCPTCHAWSVDPVVRLVPRTVLTTCGVIRVERRRVTCRSCQTSWLLPDRLAGLADYARLTDEVDGWVTTLGATLPFARAATLLERVTGIAVSAETVRRHAEARGAAWEAAQQAEATVAERQGESAAPVDPAPGQLVVETDGVMVPYRSGWHEVKVGVVGGWDGTKLTAQSYLAIRATPDAFRPRLAAESARRGAWDIVGWEGPVTGWGLALLRPVVVLGDGAVWIWNLAGECFGTRVEIVDYYHGCEHLTVVASALFGEGTDAAKAWAQAQRGQLHDNGADAVIAAIRAAAGSNHPNGDRIRRELGYFRTNRDRMRYPAFRAAGYPIGSGAVESACKLVVQQRLKGPGMRWSDAGGAAMLTLCAGLASRSPYLQAA
jgi:hypothetical protein